MRGRCHRAFRNALNFPAVTRFLMFAPPTLAETRAAATLTCVTLCAVMGSEDWRDVVLTHVSESKAQEAMLAAGVPVPPARRQGSFMHRKAPGPNFARKASLLGQ